MAYTYPVAPVGTIYQVIFNMKWCNQNLQNCYYYRCDANPSSQTIFDHYVALDTRFQAANNLYPTHKALRDTNCALDTVTIQAVAPSRYAKETFIKTEAGDVTGTTDTANLSCAITRRSVNATRWGMGTIKVPLPIAAATITDGVLTNAYETALTAHAAAMLLSYTNNVNSVFTPVLFHRTRVPNYSVVQSVFFQENARTMSRRTVGRGI